MIARFVVSVCLLVAAFSATAAYASTRDTDRPPLPQVVVAPLEATVDRPVADAVAADVVPTANPEWVADHAARTGIPARALTAYATATLRLQAEQPGCHVGWTTLAGIGWIETGHGRELDEDGRPSDTIHGPELDGTGGYAAISGDEGWDRARGPMQFIQSTWQTWASDGDGDGVADVDDIDDAAYAAGRYLCHAGGDLTTPEGWTRAVHAYNHSDEYVQSVLATANEYAARAS